jgi:hypothetical protein
MRRFALLLAAILLSYLSQPAGKYTYVTPKLVTMAARDKQHITVRLFIDLKGVAATCYTIIGISSSPMVLPPAFQVCTQPPPTTSSAAAALPSAAPAKLVEGCLGFGVGGRSGARGERGEKEGKRRGALGYAHDNDIFAASSPPLRQALKPDGSNFNTVGGIDPFMFSMFSGTKFDSWLTVGLEHDKKARLAVSGLPPSLVDPKTGWSLTKGLRATNTGIFWLDPTATTAKAGKPILVAQITVVVPQSKPNATWTASMGAQGKTQTNTTWREENIKWTWSWKAPPPPPPPPPGWVRVIEPCQTCDVSQLSAKTPLTAALIGAQKTPAPAGDCTSLSAVLAQTALALGGLDRASNKASCSKGSSVSRLVLPPAAKHVTPVVTQVATFAAGRTFQKSMTSYALSVQLGNNADSMFALIGTSTSPIVLPAAYRLLDRSSRDGTPHGVDQTVRICPASISALSCGV